MPPNEEGAALDWAKHGDEIRDLLSKKTLAQVMEHMRTKHNFNASDAQYKRRFPRCKNLTTEEWVYVDDQLERRAGLGKQTIVCFNGQELAQERVNLACSRARKKGPENRIAKPRQASKMKQHNQPRTISFRTPPPATVNGNSPAQAAVNNQGESQPIEVERNDGFDIQPQQPSPALHSVPVPCQAPEGFQAWMELDGASTTPAMCEPMMDFFGATEIELAFRFDAVDVVDIESIPGAEFGLFTTLSPQSHTHNSPRPETTVPGPDDRAASHWRPSSSPILSRVSEARAGPNFNLFGTYCGRNLQQGNQLPFFRVLFEIEHSSYSLPKHPWPSEPLPSAADASSGFLIVVQRSLPDSSVSTAELQSISSVAEVSSHLQGTIPERSEGDLSRTLERILDPSSPPWATLLSLFALAAFFASNNSLGDGQADAFLNWVLKKGYATFLIWFMKIQTPTVHAFAKVVFESAIRIKNVQVLETLLASGVKLDNKLYEIASIGDLTLTRRILFDADPAILVTTDLGVGLFHKFVCDGQYDLAQFLLGIGVSIDANRILTYAATSYSGTALYLAVGRQDVAGVKFLLEAGASANVYVYQRPPAVITFRHTALGYAVYQEYVEIILLLLEYGADILSNLQGKSVLAWAALHRRKVFELLKEKVEHGEIGFLLADALDAASRGGHALTTYIANHPEGVTAHQLEQALLQAIITDRFMAATILLQHGVDANGPTLKTRPLASALHEDYFDYGFVDLLFEHQADVGHAGLLEKLAETGEQRLLKMFLTRQIDLRQREKALVIACSRAVERFRDYGDIPSIATIIASKLDIDTPGLPRNPLQAAAANEDESTVLFLIREKANVNAPPYPRGGRTALQAALETCRSTRLARILLHHGADPSAPPALFDGLTALEAFCHNAAATNNPAFCDILLNAGAAVNRPRGEPGSALHGAIKRGWHEVLGRFLKPPHSAILDYMWCHKPLGDEWRGEWRWYTPTQLAASLGDLEALRILLDHGADVNEAPADESGRTAFQQACLLTPGPKKTALIQLLLEHGANINADAAVHCGITALQGAAIAGDLMLAQLLISLGADVNAWPSFRRGRTAVEAAAEHGRLDMVQLLLNAGATGDPMRGTGFGRAIKLAEKNDHFAVASLLK